MRISILLAPLILILLVYCPNVLEAVGPREESWERMEYYFRVELWTRGVNKTGALWDGGRVRRDPGTKSLWYLDQLLFDNVRNVYRGRDRWHAFVTFAADPQGPVREVAVVDLWRGTIREIIKLPGHLTSACLIYDGSSLAVGIRDANDPTLSHVLHFHRSHSHPSRVLSGRGVDFESLAWSPDDAAITFDAIHRSWRGRTVHPDRVRLRY